MVYMGDLLGIFKNKIPRIQNAGDFCIGIGCLFPHQTI
jgi:hypothetical protein